MYYPYWLAHAAALCIEGGLKTFLIDAPAQKTSLEKVVEKLTSFDPQLVVIDTSTPSIDADRAAAAAIKERLPKSFVAFCGTHASALPEESLGEDGADAILMGEYDQTAFQLALALRDRTELSGVSGLFLRGKGATEPRTLIENLDDLPWISPVYDKFLDVRDYYFSLAAHPMVMLITGRGCPNQCFFCLYPQVMHGRRYRYRSPEHIVGEIDYIRQRMPRVKQIVFEDDTFTADQQRTIQFSELMIQKGIRIPWFANVRVNTRYETLNVMKKAGLRACAVGFEAGDQELLDSMGKGIRIEQGRQFMRDAKSLGILIHGCFMVAFPKETEKTMQRTLKWAIELDPDSAQFYPVFPYPGTEAYRWAEKNGYLSTTDYRKWLTPDGGHACVLNLPDLPAKIIWEFCEKAYRAFHFRPKYLVKKMIQAVLHPAEGIRSIRSFAYYLLYLLTGGKR